MKAVILLLVVSFFISCNKKESRTNNEVKATILLTSGSTITINSTEANAGLGCAVSGLGTFVRAKNEHNEAIFLWGINPPRTSECITSPGTYNFSCTYHEDVTSDTQPVYFNNDVSDLGSVTFTVINDNYMEGYFNAVCRYGTDSVIVNGTFKGSY